MPYHVRTPDGELMYPTLADIERAYVQGLVDPDDEVREVGAEKWRKASSLPVLARAQRPTAKAGRAQALTVLAAVVVGVLALGLLIGGSSWNVRLLGIALALVVSALLSRVTFKAFKKPPSGT